MASRFYSVAFVLITGILGLAEQPSLPCLFAQSRKTPERKAELDQLIDEGNAAILDGERIHLWLEGTGFENQRYREAIQDWQKVLNIYRELGDRQGEGNALNKLGKVYSSLGKDELIIGESKKALSIFRQLNLSSCDPDVKSIACIDARYGEAEAMWNLRGINGGLIAQDREATEFFQKSLDIFKQLNNTVCINNLKIASCLASFQKEGNALSEIGQAYFIRGMNRKTIIDNSIQSLAIHRQIFANLCSLSTTNAECFSAKRGEELALSNLVGVYIEMRQEQKAIDIALQILGIVKQNSLEICKPNVKSSDCIASKLEEGIFLKSLGEGYSRLAKYQKSIEIYQQALTLFKYIQPINCSSNIKSLSCIAAIRGEVKTLTSMSQVYSRLGQYKKANEIAIQSQKIERNEVEESLLIAKENGDRSVEARLLLKLGNNYSKTIPNDDSTGYYISVKQAQKAIDFYQQALALTKETGDLSGEDESLEKLRYIYQKIGQKQDQDSIKFFPQAIKFYQQALEIYKERNDLYTQGGFLLDLGHAYEILGQKYRAIDFYLQALTIYRKIDNRSGEIIEHQNSPRSFKIANSGEAAALHSLGSIYESLGQNEKAFKFYVQALKVDKVIRFDFQLKSLGYAFERLGYEQQAIESYQQALIIFKQDGKHEEEGITLSKLADVFIKLKQTELAILVYKQSVNVRESIRKDIRKLDKSIQKSYLETILYSYHRLADLLIQQGRIIEALQVLDLLKVQELDDYLKNIKGNDRTSQGIRLLEPEKAFSDKLSTTSYDQIPELNQQLTNQIQQLPKSEIDKPPEYLQKLPQGTALLYPLILDDRLEIVIFAPNSPAIHRSVKIKKEQLEDLVLTFRVELRDYTSLDVKDSGKKLYDVLIKPIEEDLIQTKANTILYAPDGLLRYIPLAALYDGKQWLVEKYRINNLIAYSLFDQNSKPRSNPSIFAGAYGNSNQKLVSGFSQLPATIPEVNNIKSTFTNTTEITEQNFTAEASKNKAVGNAIVHLATHAKFQSGSPSDSYVLFGDGSKATIYDISKWNLKNVDLVVLSACQTGLGTLNGVEILGFGYQVQKAGAKASIASLWTVSDGGTQLLMQAFYENLRKSNPSLSTSLREAQLSMIHRPVKQGEPNFNHPYFWSAFVLIGNGL